MTEDSPKRFDSEGFYNALAATVKQRRVTWKEVARATGVSPTTLARMGQGRQPDATGLAALSAWSALNPADYVTLAERPEQPETLAVISTALRADPSLTGAAAEVIDSLVQSAYERLRKS
jgi:hypothetical protein